MARKILVVDDQSSVCKVLSRFLEDKGYSTIEAYSGDEAPEAGENTKVGSRARP